MFTTAELPVSQETAGQGKGWRTTAILSSPLFLVPNRQAPASHQGPAHGVPPRRGRGGVESGVATQGELGSRAELKGGECARREGRAAGVQSRVPRGETERAGEIYL